MKKRFTWHAFDVSFIKSICYSEKTKRALRPTFNTNEKDNLLPYIDRICPMPDAHFVRRYYNEILDNFLCGSTHLVSIVRTLEKRHYRNVCVGKMQDMLNQMKLLRLSSTVITLVVAELYIQGDKHLSDNTNVSIFTTPKEIDLSSCIPDDLPMYDYQKDALDSLQQFFITDKNRAGILVMPTGSGKTRVATRFLLESMVSDGWQVIWLTHRSMLIEQTASSIYTAAGSLLPLSCPSKSSFKMICVSGSHASMKATEKDDDVMICGVQSLIRNLPYLNAVINDKVFIVVDEAHHTIAPSYRIILKSIQKLAKSVKVLGLTATPVRINDIDTDRLMTIFDNKIIYSVSMSSLIARGFLSEPHYEKVDTNIDFETSITLDEKEYIKKWGELSPETLERMANVKERNALIAGTYMKNRKHYGKTLIFALNATHCISLCEELQKRGVRCDYIYCAHPGNDDKIARFKRGELDVLINIQVLTEGSDIPDINTVFLTRPTSSDVLLMQMIGRGMRGTSSGGTSTVNIVDFHDIWGNFAKWLNPEFNLCNEDHTEQEKSDMTKRRDTELVQWKQIRDILDGIHTSYAALGNSKPLSVLPIGWFDVVDESGNDSKVLVFESQLAGYVRLIKNKFLNGNLSLYTGADALHDCFRGFGLLPSETDLQLVIDTFKLTGEIPHINQLSKRKKIDASIIAKKMIETNVGIADLSNKISDIYNENKSLIDSVYGSLNDYNRRVNEFLLYPSGIKPLGAKIEEMAEESLKIDRTPIYDLQELVQEVIDKMFCGNYGKVPPVFWTDRAYSTYFGVYTYGSNGNDFIRINCVLNSKDIPRETVKYVIYHELLHRDYYYHNKEFRAKEHLYPNWTEYERFLDVTFPKFDLNYAI